MTLVSLLINIDIYKSLTIFLFRSGTDFGSGFGHGVGTDDGQARLGQQFFAEFFVGTLHAHDQRHAKIDCLARSDHASGNDVATHDAAAAVAPMDLNAFFRAQYLVDFEKTYGKERGG